MKDLEQLRGELDEIDRELVGLFLKRMGVSRDVARVKAAMGKNVLDASRERQVLESRAALASSAEDAQDVRELFTEIMRLSRGAQERLMKEAQDA